MLELKDICSGYGKKEVLHGISMILDRGELVSVVGPNGCGKSTLLKTASGIICPREGEIFIDGELLSSLKRGEIAKHIAYLAQGKSAPDMTVEQMVLHGRFPYLDYPKGYSEDDRRMAQKAMVSVGVDGFAGMPVSSLSGGMRQNAYIAMALAQDTDYILLDEPTTYLDVSHMLSLMRMLSSLAERGKGVLAVMHDLPTALRFSHRIIVLENGRVALEGSPQEIYASGELERIFGVPIIVTDSGEYCYRYGK